MEMIKVAVIGLAVVMFSTELRTYKPVLSMIVGMAGAVFIMLISVDKILLVLEQVQDIFQYLGEGAAYFIILLKVVGVTYLCQFSSGVCKDAGYGNLAEQIQIFGKLYIMASGMPILMAFMETIKSF